MAGSGAVRVFTGDHALSGSLRDAVPAALRRRPAADRSAAGFLPLLRGAERGEPGVVFHSWAVRHRFEDALFPVAISVCITGK